MAEQKCNKYMHYKRVNFISTTARPFTGKHSKTFSDYIEEAFAVFKTQPERKVVDGAKVTECIDYKVKDLKASIQLSTCTEGEPASTIKFVAGVGAKDLSSLPAPEGEEFVDGDIHLLVIGNDILMLLCLSARDTTIQRYFEAVFDKAKMNVPSFEFTKPMRKDALKLLGQGIKEVALNASAGQPLIDSANQTTNLISRQIRSFMASFLHKERTLDEAKSADDVKFKVSIGSKGHIQPSSQNQKNLQALCKTLIEEDNDDSFCIITKDGTRITPDSIQYKATARLTKNAKTVSQLEAKEKLEEFATALMQRGVIARPYKP